MSSNPPASTKEYCAYCGTNHDFVFPSELFQSITAHEAVFFAGAGISTEGGNVLPTTLYEDILEEMGYSADDAPSFSKLMSEFCAKNGDRRELIEQITKRIEYVRSFPGLYSDTVGFHRLLATIPCIKEVVTTNWDDFFETECHATPFVYEQDMVFWERPGRKVLKLHGSINNLGSIVVTSEDYENRYQSLNNGLVGSQLKLLIAKNRLIFVGYSFNDEHLSRLYSFVRSQLGDFMKKPYIITLDTLNDKKWKEMGLMPIYTSGSYFLQVLIHKLLQRDCLIPETNMAAVLRELNQTREEHIRLSNSVSISDKPELVYCLSYQDGVIHAFEHLLHHVNYGESLCKARINGILQTYEGLVKEKRLHKQWYDVAYLTGYLNGHVFVMLSKNERRHFPRYLDLSMGRQLRTIQEYKRSLAVPQRQRKSISDYAIRFAKKFPHRDVVVQHTYSL